MVKLVGVGLLALQVGRVETMVGVFGALWSGLLFGFWAVSTRPFA